MSGGSFSLNPRFSEKELKAWRSLTPEQKKQLSMLNNENYETAPSASSFLKTEMKKKEKANLDKIYELIGKYKDNPNLTNFEVVEIINTIMDILTKLEISNLSTKRFSDVTYDVENAKQILDELHNALYYNVFIRNDPNLLKKEIKEVFLDYDLDSIGTGDFKPSLLSQQVHYNSGNIYV